MSQSKTNFAETLATPVFEDDTDTNYLAENKIVQVQARIGLHFFRRAMISAYAGRCGLAGITHPTLLVASHIVAWKAEKDNRLNPRNGLCLSALHDKAFDKGLLTITPDNEIKISTSIHALTNNRFAEEWLIGLEGKKLPCQ